MNIEPHTFTHDGDRVLGLRRCNADGTSYRGFAWPREGPVVADNWEPTDCCGHGLHCWPWGLGLGEGCDFDLIEDRWQVLEIDPRTPIVGNLEGGWKMKCRECVVRTFDNFSDAWDVIAAGQAALIALMAAGGKNKLVATEVGSKLVATGADSRLVAAGAGSTLVAVGADSELVAAGTDSRLIATSKRSKLAATGLESCCVAVGAESKLVAADVASKLVAAGADSTLAVVGRYSKLTAIGAESCCMAAGVGSKVRVGDGGAFCLRGNDPAGNPRLVVGHVGENSIVANTWYELDENLQIVPVE